MQQDLLREYKAVKLEEAAAMDELTPEGEAHSRPIAKTIAAQQVKLRGYVVTLARPHLQHFGVSRLTIGD